MRKSLAVACGFVVCLASSAGAVILHVPSEYPTIHAASLVEVAGDTILVAPGQYDEGSTQLIISPGTSVISEQGRDATYITNAGMLFIDTPPSSLSSYLIGFTMDDVGLRLDHPSSGVVVAENRLVTTTVGISHIRVESSCSLTDNLIKSRGLVTIDIWNPRLEDMSVTLTRNLIVYDSWDYTIWLGGVPSCGFIELTMRDNTCISFYGVYVQGNPPPPCNIEVVNNIFYSWMTVVSALFCDLHSNITYHVSHNCFWDAGFGCPDGGGNFYADPMFCDLPAEDYRLHPDSPCIGSGEGGTNIGAFPIGCGSTGIPSSGVQTHQTHLTVRPNPVLHGARFTFATEHAMPLALQIYDPQGRLIETLEPMGPFTWSPASTATSGVYFARLRGNGVSEVVKFVVLR